MIPAKQREKYSNRFESRSIKAELEKEADLKDKDENDIIYVN